MLVRQIGNFKNGANFNGSDTLTVLSTDTNGATDADAVSITVASVNRVSAVRRLIDPSGFE